MAERLVEFQAAVVDDEGRRYTAAAYGAAASDGLWEGWIEFTPVDGGQALRTGWETRQPDRSDLAYWATGLTPSYLEGALDRALRANSRGAPPGTFARGAAYEQALETTTAPPQARPRAVLDPFEVYPQGEEVLREELNALDNGHLLNIVLAYGLVSAPIDAAALDRSELIALIMEAARSRQG